MSSSSHSSSKKGFSKSKGHGSKGKLPAIKSKGKTKGFGFKIPKKGGSLKISSNQHSGNAPVAKKKDEGFFDMEQQFILRMPPGSAMALRRDVELGANNLKDKLTIELQHDHRHGSVRYGGQIFNAKLVDLPTIVESLKTTDNKTFYKTADICQMLICGEDDDSDSQEETDLKKKDKKFKYPHGLTPPLKNVRKKRFRKTLKKRYQEQPDIEKEVKRLFRMDNEAIDVKWEVVKDEEQPSTSQSPNHKQEQVIVHGETSNVHPAGELAVHDVFGDVSSSEEDEKDINIMDMSGDDEDASRLDSLVEADFTEKSAPSFDDQDDFNVKLQELSRELGNIGIRKKQLESDIIEAGEAENIEAKESLQQELGDLVKRHVEVKNEYEILNSVS